MNTPPSAEEAGRNNAPTLLHTALSVLRKERLAWIVLVAGLMITAIATLSMKTSVERIAVGEFTSRCNEIQNAIRERLDDHARILQNGAALFNASDAVSRKEWHLFNETGKFAEQLPGIQGNGFSLLIPRAELGRHIQQIRREGFPQYNLSPAGDREVYSSIIYLEPFSGRNLRAFGYDMFSERVRRIAMAQARDTDAAALSGKVALVQETGVDVQAGTLMYYPVYRKGMPTGTIEQRRAAIYGWVYSVYRMNDLLQGIMSNNILVKEKNAYFQIFDGEQPSPQSLLYESHSIGGKKSEGQILHQSLVRFTRQDFLDFNGQRWTLRFQQASDGYFTMAYIGVWFTMIGGIIVSFLLFALIGTLLHTRTEAQCIADDLTKDLRNSELHLSSISDRLTLAVRAGGVGIWDYDAVNNALVWDDQMFRLYGITRDQFDGAYEAWQAGVHPDDRQRSDEEIQLALRGEKDFDTEFRVLHPDGSIHTIRALALVQHDAAGAP